MTKDDIVELQQRYCEQERDERSVLLSSHNEKWHLIRQTLYSLCRDNNGHDYIDLPDNGVNRPHFITGFWPQKCKFCGRTVYQDSEY
jgi:hypothetical protein